MSGATFWETLLLGLLQGLTEFLPISSSGHLVLAQALLGVEAPGVALEIVLHAGTLLAVVAYYRRDLVHLAAGVLRFAATGGRDGRRDAHYVLWLVVGTIPVVVVGLLLKSSVEEVFQSARVAALLLMGTGLLLLSTRFYRRGDRGMGPGPALLAGVFQAVSLLPGVSRSGATISAGLLAGIRPREAARFSFLLSIPAIVGAVVVTLPEVAREASGGAVGAYAAGFAAAAVSGYAAIAVLLRVIGRGHLAPFGLYCLLAGALGLLVL